MARKDSGWWAGLGSVLGGVAALLTALFGGVALLYFNGDADQSEPAVRSAKADQPDSNAPVVRGDDDGGVSKSVPVGVHPKASRFDAMAARTDMFVARKVALNARCNSTQPEVYARGEITHENAEEDLRAERYDLAQEGFRKAGAHYRECGKVG